MTESRSNAVGGICRSRRGFETEVLLDHERHLSLGCYAAADDYILYLGRGILRHRKSASGRRQQYDSAGMTEYDCCAYVLPIENALDAERVRARSLDHLRNPLENLEQAFRQRPTGRRPNRTAFDQSELPGIVFGDYAISGHLSAGINAEYDHRTAHLSRRTPIPNRPSLVWPY